MYIHIYIYIHTHSIHVYRRHYYVFSMLFFLRGGGRKLGRRPALQPPSDAWAAPVKQQGETTIVHNSL